MDNLMNVLRNHCGDCSEESIFRGVTNAFRGAANGYTTTKATSMHNDLSSPVLTNDM